MQGSICYVNASRTLYHSLVRSQLEYRLVVWSPHTKRVIDLIEHVQRIATKLILKSDCNNYESRLKQLNLNFLEQRCFMAIKKFYFLDNHYTFQSHLKLKKNFFKTTSFKHSFLNRIVDSWNNLGCEFSFSHDLHSLLKAWC